jgi:O-antigen ligase
MAEPSASIRIAIAAEHSVEAENVDYRRTLIDVAFDAIRASPWFGGIDIYGGGKCKSQSSRGFHRVVNSYVGILLTSGFVGLFLFLGFFATICLGVYGTKQIGDSTDERRLLGRALLARAESPGKFARPTRASAGK